MPHLRLYNKRQISLPAAHGQGIWSCGPSTPVLGSLSFPVSVCVLILRTSLWLYFSTLFISSGALALMYNNLFIHLTVHFLSPPLGITHLVGPVHPALCRFPQA